MSLLTPFKSVGHFLATVFEKAPAALAKVAAKEGVIEDVTSIIPVYGTTAVSVEKVAFAVLGEVAAVLVASDAAVHAKLLDAGLDEKVIQTVEELLKKFPTALAVLTK